MTLCPICDKISTLKQKALIAPFIQVRCDIKDETTNSCFCVNCQFVYFERRLSEDEASKLYTGYRNHTYNELRLSVEPSYSEYIEMFDDPFSSYWVGRTNELMGVVRKNKAMDAKCILDFGGDGMIPSRIVPKATIYISDPAHGHTQDAPSTFDLIFASEVFEHLSDPKSNLERLVEQMNSTSLLIIDVPLEYSGSIKQEWDRQAVMPGSLVTMHEHINHFSIEALEQLAKSVNLKTVSIEITPLSFLIGVFQVNI